MTRTHALRQLLALGPLTFRELREITGWPPRQTSGLLRYLQDFGFVAFDGGLWRRT